MPVGPGPVNAAPEPIADWPDRRWLKSRRCDSVPRKNLKHDAGIWPEYGAARIKALFIYWASENFPDLQSEPEKWAFLVDNARGQRLYTAIGAPSAYGAIARL